MVGVFFVKSSILKTYYSSGNSRGDATLPGITCGRSLLTPSGVECVQMSVNLIVTYRHFPICGYGVLREGK